LNEKEKKLVGRLKIFLNENDKKLVGRFKRSVKMVFDLPPTENP
jgi:hypothetical protein